MNRASPIPARVEHSDTSEVAVWGGCEDWLRACRRSRQDEIICYCGTRFGKRLIKCSHIVRRKIQQSASLLPRQ